MKDITLYFKNAVQKHTQAEILSFAENVESRLKCAPAYKKKPDVNISTSLAVYNWDFVISTSQDNPAIRDTIGDILELLGETSYMTKTNVHSRRDKPAQSMTFYLTPQI